MYLLAETYGGTSVLTVTTPRFTQQVAGDVRAEAMEALRDETETYLVDLGHVVHMDSAALGVLIALVKRIGRHRRLELCAPAPAVRKLLRLTHMDDVFRIHHTLTEGLDAHFVPRARTA